MQLYNRHLVSVCLSVSLSVRSDFSAPLRARNPKFGTKDTYVTAIRPEKGFCEIRLFRPHYAPKTSKNPENLVPKMEFSVFSQFRVHFFMDHHHFWFVSCYGVGEEEDKRI